MAVEKRVNSTLIIPSSIEKIFEVDKHIACAVSGLVADARTLIERARTEAAHHWFVYNEKMTIEDVTKAVSNLALAFGDDDMESGAMSRPFGVALLFSGVDERGPQLYHMDPSGTYIRYEAKAIGSGSEGAQQALQEIYHKNMTLHEGCKHALSILKQVMEEKLDSTNVEKSVNMQLSNWSDSYIIPLCVTLSIRTGMATVSIKDNYHLFNKDEVQRIIEEINQPSL
uniref:Proteasome subunit alpha type-5 n=1 Tax=Schistosoma haematobium TaxID=6185 RepID=A0A094ZQ59_SCHHA